MVTTLTKHGDDMALVLSKDTLAALGIDADTPLEIVAADGRLIVERVHVGVDSDRLRRHTAEVRKRYSGALQRLAE